MRVIPRWLAHLALVLEAFALLGSSQTSRATWRESPAELHPPSASPVGLELHGLVLDLCPATGGNEVAFGKGDGLAAAVAKGGWLRSFRPAYSRSAGCRTYEYVT